MLFSTVYPEKHCKVWVFLSLVNTASKALTEFLRHFHLEFQMPPIRWNVFPGITNNFYIGRFWGFYVKFWERARLLRWRLGFYSLRPKI
jgi:hypothetical protein